MNFKDDGAIPEVLKTTVYVSICVESEYEWMIGEVNISNSNFAENDGGYIFLGSIDVEIPLNTIAIDFNSREIEGLEKKKQKELARHHVQMKEYQDRIDSLLAIEYQPEEAA